jgi:hypothetical protein
MPGGGGKGGKGGGASSTVTVHNGPVTVDADSTVEVVGLDRINVTARLEPTPFKTEARQELVLPQPLKTENVSTSELTTRSDINSDSRSALSVDLEPVALDVCLNTKLPHGQICQPYSFHLGLTLFGVEWFGLNFGGESRTIIQDVPRTPAITWPAQQHAPADRPASSRDAVQPAGGRGLVVRIK